MKKSEIKFLEEHGFSRYHSNSDDYWRQRGKGRYVQVSKKEKGWIAIHSTSGPAGRYWKGPVMSGPISAFVHAELENWGEP